MNISGRVESKKKGLLSEKRENISESKSDNYLQNTKDDAKIKICKRRWTVLFIYVGLAIIVSYQHFQYVVINNIVVKYYRESSSTVNWTAVVYTLTYPFMVIPIMYVSEKKGLRTVIATGGLLTTFWTVVKLFSVQQNLFWVVLLAQFFNSLVSPVTMGSTTNLAALWFPLDEVTTACSIAMFGVQMGNALGFFLPTLIVRNHANTEEIGKDLYISLWAVAGPAIIIAIAIVFYFPRQPPLPPSLGQLDNRNRRTTFETSSFLKIVGLLLKNRPYMTNLLAYDVILTILTVNGTLLNQYVLAHFPNGEADVGRLGLLNIGSGLLGIIICGIVLDKTRKFKECAVVIYSMNCICTIAAGFAFQYNSKSSLYVAWAFQGFFMNAYLIVGSEMSTELTYPVPEAITTGFMVAPSQVFSTVFTILVNWVFKTYGTIWVLAGEAIVLFAGIFVMACIPNELKRQMYGGRNECIPLNSEGINI